MKTKYASSALKAVAAINEIRRANVATIPDDWFTLGQLAEELGYTRWGALRWLHSLRDAGRLETGQHPCQDATGRKRYTPIYRVIESTSQKSARPRK